MLLLRFFHLSCSCVFVRYEQWLALTSSMLNNRGLGVTFDVKVSHLCLPNTMPNCYSDHNPSILFTAVHSFGGKNRYYNL